MSDRFCDRIARSLALVLLLLLFALLVLGARQLSFTFDEPSHLASGYTFLARRATWMIARRGHPLLVDAWLALPLYLGDPNIPVETLEGWDGDYVRYVDAFGRFLVRALDRAQMAGRVPSALLSVLLAVVIYRWGVDVGGEWVGLLALTLLTFDPTFLAHGRLATNDMGVTALGTLGLYLVGRWMRRPTWGRSASAGLILGMTMVAKGSGLFWAVVGLGWAWWIGLGRRDRYPFAWRQVLLMTALLGGVVWGMYGFSLGLVSDWPAVPVPAPQYWQGLFVHAQRVLEGAVIALGEVRPTPWFWYFPLAFLVKNPLPLLIALPLALGALAAGQRWHWLHRRRLGLLGLFSVLYVALALTRGFNLGYRHMFPIHPLLHLMVASGIGILWQRVPRVGQWGVVVLGIWYLVGTMRFYPYNIAFFNELVGGPENGWRYLSDSNTDWGQGWKALRKFRDERSLTFRYSGPEGYAGITPYDLWDRSLPPLRYVSEPLPNPWLFPQTGDYVISANSLSGLYLVNVDAFSWFRYHPYDAIIAHTLFYYHVDATMAPTWLAQCTLPRTPLSQDAIADGFEAIDLRFATFDCHRSWVYPGGGRARGVYALHDAILRPETLKERLYLAPVQPIDPFAARHLKDVSLAYRQSDYGTLPAFALYEWRGGGTSVPSSIAVEAAPADVFPGTFSKAPPMALDGPLTFLGLEAYLGDEDGQEMLEVETWWLVAEGPVERPFSIMAHLLNEGGSVLGTNDGLGVLPETLKAGDVIVQRHRFGKPTGDGQVFLRTGAYWLDAVSPWPVVGEPNANALFVPLEWE